MLLGEDLKGRIRRIGKLEKNPQRLLVWYQDFRLGELTFVHVDYMTCVWFCAMIAFLN